MKATFGTTTRKSTAAQGPLAAQLRRDATDWPAILRRVQQKIVRDRVSLSAGSLAYHWFLSIFPAVIAFIGLLTMVQVSAGTISHLTHAADTSLPSGVSAVFDAAFVAAGKRTAGSLFAFVAGLFVALWSASGGIAALEQALDVAYEVPVDRSYLVRKLRALPLKLATVVLGGGGAALAVFGAPLGAALEGHVPLHGAGFVVIWTIVRWVLTATAVALLFSIYYLLGPNLEVPKWKWASAGSIFATVVFLAASFGFSFYVDMFGSYGKTYGTFAGVAILIFWLYLTGLAILVGGEVNAELEREANVEVRPQHGASAENPPS